MKSKEEIRNEIEITNKAIKNCRKDYNEKKIPKDVFLNKVIELTATINALKWVLGENNRYD